MQSATTLAIGTDGITIPVIQRSVGMTVDNTDYTGVTVILHVPVLNAGTHTVATSDDGGASWLSVSGPIALTSMEQVNPTAATSTGSWRAIYGPYLPGTMFRLTSSVDQSDKLAAAVRYMV